ncbi:MAG: hypothetical protein HYX62_01820 [Gammaproteobacteria bacterium]|jgi:hypothetical protein|nr:hypothetical protein [Gammaproteobacteria bacterium]
MVIDFWARRVGTLVKLAQEVNQIDQQLAAILVVGVALVVLALIVLHGGERP